MFKWKKNASRDSIAVSKDSFARSRDSFVVTSPSAMSETNSGPDTSGLFIQDYRDSRQPKDSGAQAASVYTPTSSRSHSSSPEVVSKHAETPKFQQVQPPRPPSFVSIPTAPAPAPQPAASSTPTSSAPLMANFAYLELETHNNAFEQHNRLLCARVTELKTKHAELISEIKFEEEEKAKFQEHVAILRKRLGQVTHALEAQRELCTTVDKLIEETEDGYMKIVETSKTILQMLDNDYSQIYNRRAVAESAYRD